MSETSEQRSDTSGHTNQPAEEPKFVTQAFAHDDLDDYAEDRAGVAIRCQFCVGQRFRRSRLRGEDFKGLLLMRYPVRCLRCSQRQLVSFTIAGISLGSHVRPQRKRRSLQQKASTRPPAE